MKTATSVICLTIAILANAALYSDGTANARTTTTSIPLWHDGNTLVLITKGGTHYDLTSWSVDTAHSVCYGAGKIIHISHTASAAPVVKQELVASVRVSLDDVQKAYPMVTDQSKAIWQDDSERQLASAPNPVVCYASVGTIWTDLPVSNMFEFGFGLGFDAHSVEFRYASGSNGTVTSYSHYGLILIVPILESTSKSQDEASTYSLLYRYSFKRGGLGLGVCAGIAVTNTIHRTETNVRDSSSAGFMYAETWHYSDIATSTASNVQVPLGIEASLHLFDGFGLHAGGRVLLGSGQQSYQFSLGLAVGLLPGRATEAAKPLQ